MKMSDCCCRCGEKDGPLFWENGEPYCREHVPEALAFANDERITELEEQVEYLVARLDAAEARIKTLEVLASTT
jgi:hypothetical protein